MNNQTHEGVAIKKVTNVFSKKILAKRALREIKLLQHFRGHRNVGSTVLVARSFHVAKRQMPGTALMPRPGITDHLSL